MENLVLDIWAIQNNPSEIYAALQNIKSDVLIYKNVMCKFKIAGRNVKSLKYNDIIYSKDSDVVIFLLHSNKKILEQAEAYFEQNNIDYNIVEFMDTESKKNKQNETENLPEFWFARDVYVLEDAVKESVSMGNSNCQFYPNIQSLIRFKHPTIKADASMGSEDLFGVNFLGLIKFEDKIILPTYAENENNITLTDILNILKKYEVSFEVDEEETLSLN